MRDFFKVFKWISKIGIRYAIFLAVILTVYVTLIIVDSRIVDTMVEKETTSRSDYVSIKAEHTIVSYLQTCIEALNMTANGIEKMMGEDAGSMAIKDYLTLQTENYAEVIDENYRGLYGLIQGGFLDGSGWVPDKNYRPKSRPWYVDAVEANGEIALVDPYMDLQTKKVTMSMSKLLSDGYSVAAIDLSLGRVQEICEEIGKEFDDTEVMLISSDGTIVAHSIQSRTLGNIFGKTEMLRAYKAEDLKNMDRNKVTVRYKGKRYSIYFHEIYDNWYIMTSICIDAMDKRKSGSFAIHTIAIVLLIGGMVGLFCHIGKRRYEASKNFSQMYSISGIYSTMDLINLEEDTFQMVRCDGKELRNSQEGMTVGAHRIMRETMWACTAEASQNKIFSFIDLESLDDRMSDTDTISVEYLDNNNRWCRGRFTVVERKKNGKLRSVLWMIEPIDKEKREREHLEWLSETDRLTGIMNRGGGEEKIRQIIENGGVGMLAIMDADKFKSINDTFGHQVGDAVIIAIANCLKKSFRDVDVVMRLGGDEFAVFVSDMNDKVVANQIIDRFIDRVYDIAIPQITDRKIEVSIGAAFMNQTDIKDFETLYKKADSGVYRSKKVQGSYVTFVD